MEKIVVIETGQGGTGSPGANGWTPALANVSRGADTVQQVIDWFGGTGTKPITGQYIGVTGLVSDIADAKAIQGPQGIQGVPGRAPQVYEQAEEPTGPDIQDGDFWIQP